MAYGVLLSGRRGSKPSTFGLGMSKHPVASDGIKGLAPTPSAACTSACTSEAENVNAEALDTASPVPLQVPADQGNEGEGIDHGGAGRGSSTADQGDPLAVLAAAVANLSPADRERLAVMLTGNQGEGQGGRMTRQTVGLMAKESRAWPWTAPGPSMGVGARQAAVNVPLPAPESTPPAGDRSAVDGADIADNPRGPTGHRKLFPTPRVAHDSTLVYSPPINTKKSRQFRQGDIHRARIENPTDRPLAT